MALQTICSFILFVSEWTRIGILYRMSVRWSQSDSARDWHVVSVRFETLQFQNVPTSLFADCILLFRRTVCWFDRNDLKSLKEVLPCVEKERRNASVNWEVFRNRLRTVSERLKPNKGILFQISRYIWYIYIGKKNQNRSQTRAKRAVLQMRRRPLTRRFIVTEGFFRRMAPWLIYQIS
jgi:hypothetical protein